MELCAKRFEELTVRQLYDILALRAQIFVVEQACPYADVDGQDYNAWQLFATENDEIVAGLRILPKNNDRECVAIGRVVVAPHFRRQGLAQKLLAFGLDFIKNNLNEKKVMLSAQIYAISLYENAGFKAVSQEYLEDGIPHIDMTVDLP